MDETNGVNSAAAIIDDAKEKETLSKSKAFDLEKCLEENKGDNKKCKDKVEAFRSSSSSSPSSSPPRNSRRSRKPLMPIKLRRGSLTDV
ncbi:hypothetical protein DITRI_Ditri11bG0152400 [Diplodiscus trichospermus]